MQSKMKISHLEFSYSSLLINTKYIFDLTLFELTLMKDLRALLHLIKLVVSEERKHLSCQKTRAGMNNSLLVTYCRSRALSSSMFCNKSKLIGKFISNKIAYFSPINYLFWFGNQCSLYFPRVAIASKKKI